VDLKAARRPEHSEFVDLLGKKKATTGKVGPRKYLGRHASRVQRGGRRPRGADAVYLRVRRSHAARHGQAERHFRLGPKEGREAYTVDVPFSIL
jgi:hypothetical protein